MRPDADVVTSAAQLSHGLLGGLGARWEHTVGVAGRAAAAAEVLPEAARPTLVAAAWLHDIGYAPSLRRSGFHPLDGARALADAGWDPLVAALVAQHSGARFVAAVRELEEPMGQFDDPRAVEGPLADALTYADQTVGPQGRPIGVEERLADMLRRHGPDSPNARCHHVRGPVIRAAVARTESALAGPAR